MLREQRGLFVADPMGSTVKTKLMEYCHNAYLQAIAAQACCDRFKPELDIHKLDWILMHEHAKIPIGVQLKRTHTRCVAGEAVTYKMDSQTHRVLREVDGMRRFLFLLALPESDRWVTQIDGALTMRHAMYWLNIEGDAPLPAGQKSKTFIFPTTQVVTAEWLCAVFRKLFDEVTAA